MLPERQPTHSFMSVSGRCTSVPGTVRVWGAVADTPQSTQTVSCGLRQRQGEETPVVGRQRVNSGSGVMLSLGVGIASARLRAERHSTTSQSPLSHTHAQQESVPTWLACTTDTAQAAHAQAQPHVTPTQFHPPHPTPHHTTPHHTTPHHTTPHHNTTQHNTILHYTTLHYTTLHYTTLHYTTLHYTTLHYTTLHTTHYTPHTTHHTPHTTTRTHHHHQSVSLEQRCFCVAYTVETMLVPCTVLA